MKNKRFKTQFELKLDKLPARIEAYNVSYMINISKIIDYKDHKNTLWTIEYQDPLTENSILAIVNKSLQECVDRALQQYKIIKKELKNEYV